MGNVDASGGTAGSSVGNTPGGVGSDGRIRFDANNVVGGSVSPGVGFTGPLPYTMTGTTTTPVIAPQNVCAWGKVSFSIDTKASGSNLVVDVLDNADMVLAPQVMNGTDLGMIPAVIAAKSIKLRATLTAGKGGTPKLTSWKLDYYTP
jgi:hypothetical protein